MLRKTFALAVALLICSVAPATAMIGFCAKMPCCEHEAGAVAQPVLTTERADCCTTINCYEAPPHELAVSGKAKDFLATTLGTLPVTTAMPEAAVARRLTFDDTSAPPTTSERLSTLSIFLI